jgi:hypothetical protein
MLLITKFLWKKGYGVDHLTSLPSHPEISNITLMCVCIYVMYYCSLNPMPNAQVCVYLTIHITKLQLQTNENINIVIEFNPYVMPSMDG